MPVFLDYLRVLIARSHPASLTRDAEGSALWIAKALSDSGYRANFSLESLRELDRFFDEQVTDGRANAAGSLSKQLGQRLFCLGAYTGEVIRRNVGGDWEGNDDSSEAEIDLALRLPNGSLMWPVQRVMKRFQLGPAESLYVYAISCVHTSSSTG